MNLQLRTCRVRDWQPADAPSLVRNANNRNVSINLRDRFPFPYHDEDARAFLEHVRRVQPVTAWAIDVDGEAVGGIGVNLLTDVERVSAEIGYWLGEPYWGRGVATEALVAVTMQAFTRFALTRIFALPFADNLGSIRVLEKAGYVLEGTMRRSAIKDGVIRDQLLYASYRGFEVPGFPAGR